MGKRGPPPRKTEQASLRFEPSLRDKIKASADGNGRNFSEEVMARLEHSLAVDEQLGDAETYGLALLMGIMAESVRNLTGYAWHEHPWSFHRFSEALEPLLDYFLPTGPEEFPIGSPRLGSLLAMFGPEEFERSFSEAAANSYAKTMPAMAVLTLEAVVDHGAFGEAKALRPVAAALVEKLDAAGFRGEAIKEYMRRFPK